MMFPIAFFKNTYIKNVYKERMHATSLSYAQSVNHIINYTKCISIHKWYIQD